LGALAGALAPALARFAVRAGRALGAGALALLAGAAGAGSSASAADGTRRAIARGSTRARESFMEILSGGQDRVPGSRGRDNVAVQQSGRRS
jgi:hypothetical protein